jgi:hypothetical protein
MNGTRFKTGDGFHAYSLFGAALILPPALVYRERLFGVLFYFALSFGVPDHGTCEVQ